MTPCSAPAVPTGLIAEKCLRAPKRQPLAITADFYGSPHGIVLGREVRARVKIAALRRAGRLGIIEDRVTLMAPPVPSSPRVAAMLAANAMGGCDGPR